MELLQGRKTSVTFNTSTDQEARDAGEHTTKTVCIEWDNCSLEDVLTFAAETVKIRQIQTRIRNGKAVSASFRASRPGTKSVTLPDIATLLANASPEQRAEYIEMLQALRDKQDNEDNQ
jgi:hypothetical protein